MKGTHVDEKQAIDWQAATNDYRDRITHILGVLGVIASYGLVTHAYEFAQQLGVGAWWETIFLWVLAPIWVLGVGAVSMKAPKLIFWGLPTPYAPLATLPTRTMKPQQNPTQKNPSKAASEVAAKILAKKAQRAAEQNQASNPKD